MKEFCLPPGPRGALFQTVRLAREPLGMLRDNVARYGDPFSVPTLLGAMVVTGRPEGIETIFAADPETFGPGLAAFFGWIIGRESLAMLNGEQHHRRRKLIVPAFHGSRMKGHGHAIQQGVLRRIGVLQPGARIKFVRLAHELTRENLNRIVFGVQGRAHVARFDEAIRDLFATMTLRSILLPPQLLKLDLFGFAPWRKLQRWRATFDSLVYEEIRARRQSGVQGDDMLSTLLLARDEQGRGMTDINVRDELLTFLASGSDSSALAVTWALYWVSRNPLVYERLMAELRPLGREPDPGELARLPFLDAICSETLRLHPITPWVERRLLQPFKLLGYRLPTGTLAVAATALTHENPTIYPEPMRFRPERFLERRFSRSEYLPFGGGARYCPGAVFAMYQLKIIIGSLFAAHRFELAGGLPVEPARFGLLMGPQGGVPAIYRGPI